MPENLKNKILGLEFTQQDINEASRDNRLLSMEIELSLRCNFKCPYCYTPQESDFENELTVEEIRQTIFQAKESGAKKIIILGGEPTIYPHLTETIKYIRGLGLGIEMFTNGSGISPGLALDLFSENVSIVLKMNTFDKDLQDKLTGTPGSYEIIKNAFRNLNTAGYPSNDAFLAASTIICRQNIKELPELWVWLRDRNILPYFEIITPQEKAKQNDWLHVHPLEIKELFQKISDLDKKKYGIEWVPQPPLVGNRCMRHQFSCFVTSRGEVMPCVGVTIPMGNIRKEKLGDIIKNSEILRQLKDFRHTIKGGCKTCKKADHCYGCRGAAYQLTGDFLASDPTCWENA